MATLRGKLGGAGNAVAESVGGALPPAGTLSQPGVWKSKAAGRQQSYLLTPPVHLPDSAGERYSHTPSPLVVSKNPQAPFARSWA